MNGKNNIGLTSQDLSMNSNLRETLQKFQHYQKSHKNSPTMHH